MKQYGLSLVSIIDVDFESLEKIAKLEYLGDPIDPKWFLKTSEFCREGKSVIGGRSSGKSTISRLISEHLIKESLAQTKLGVELSVQCPSDQGSLQKLNKHKGGRYSSPYMIGKQR